MKIKTLLLALFCVFCMSGTALAYSIYFSGADLNIYDWVGKMESDYGITVYKDGGWMSTQTGLGDKYTSSDPRWNTPDNYYNGFGNSSGNVVMSFEQVSVYGIILESLSIEKSAGIWTFTHTSGGTSVIDVTAPTPGDDFVTLYGDLIDYALGGIVSFTYTPGAWPNGDFHFYSMGYSAATPIPGALWLMGTGLAGLVAYRRKMAK